jgi:hypothetical protein
MGTDPEGVCPRCGGTVLSAKDNCQEVEGVVASLDAAPRTAGVPDRPIPRHLARQRRIDALRGRRRPQWLSRLPGSRVRPREMAGVRVLFDGYALSPRTTRRPRAALARNAEAQGPLWPIPQRAARPLGARIRGPIPSKPIATERHAVAACAYVAVNPVEAGLCSTAGAWPWSSHRAILGEADRWPFLAPLEELGITVPTYRRMVAHREQEIQEIHARGDRNFGDRPLRDLSP